MKTIIVVVIALSAIVCFVLLVHGEIERREAFMLEQTEAAVDKVENSGIKCESNCVPGAVIDKLTTTDNGTITTSNPPEPKWASDLRAAAAKRSLRWYVFCAGDSGYIGVAEPMDMPKHAKYIEDGAKPHWNVGGHSQQEAARLLLSEIVRNDPKSLNLFYPEHRHEAEKKGECKPDISGGGMHATDEFAVDCKDCGK
jgi:hypothetical protein